MFYYPCSPFYDGFSPIFYSKHESGYSTVQLNRSYFSVSNRSDSGQEPITLLWLRLLLPKYYKQQIHDQKSNDQHTVVT